MISHTRNSGVLHVANCALPPHLWKHLRLFVCCGICFWSWVNELVLVNGCWLLEVNFSADVTVLTDRPTPHRKTARLKLVERKQMLALGDEPEREGRAAPLAMFFRRTGWYWFLSHNNQIQNNWILESQLNRIPRKKNNKNKPRSELTFFPLLAS